MKLIKSHDPKLIAKYDMLYNLMTEHQIDGVIGTVLYGSSENLRIFVQKDDKFHMVRFDEHTPIIGKYPWPIVNVYNTRTETILEIYSHDDYDDDDDE